MSDAIKFIFAILAYMAMVLGIILWLAVLPTVGLLWIWGWLT